MIICTFVLACVATMQWNGTGLYYQPAFTKVESNYHHQLLSGCGSYEIVSPTSLVDFMLHETFIRDNPTLSTKQLLIAYSFYCSWFERDHKKILENKITREEGVGKYDLIHFLIKDVSQLTDNLLTQKAYLSHCRTLHAFKIQLCISWFYGAKMSEAPIGLRKV